MLEILDTVFYEHVVTASKQLSTDIAASAPLMLSSVS